MIEVQHLNLAFGEGEKRNQVLYDVSFHVKPGGFIAGCIRLGFCAGSAPSQRSGLGACLCFLQP